MDEAVDLDQVHEVGHLGPVPVYQPYRVLALVPGEGAARALNTQGRAEFD